MLLQKLGASGAAGGESRGLLVTDEPQLEELLAKGYVQKMTLLGNLDHPYFTLTALGRSFFQPSMKVEKPIPLMQFKRMNIGDDLSNYTGAELVLHLAKLGWRDVDQKKSKKIPPYTAEGDKVWYKSSGARISRLYLRALAVSNQRFRESSINELHHFQSQAYYRCIVDGIPGVKPNQPLNFYKLLTKGRSKSSTITDEFNDADDPSGFEELGGSSNLGEGKGWVCRICCVYLFHHSFFSSEILSSKFYYFISPDSGLQK